MSPVKVFEVTEHLEENTAAVTRGHVSQRLFLQDHSVKWELGGEHGVKAAALHSVLLKERDTFYHIKLQIQHK